MQNPEPDSYDPEPETAHDPEPAPFAEASEPAEESFIQKAKKTLIRVGLPSRIARPRQDGYASLSHHEAHCTICQHPDRDAIDQAFLHWERPSAIAHNFNLGNRRTVYRHAHALGLYQLRGIQTRRTLEFIMEQAESVTATADTVIRAVRAYSCVGEDGVWTEPTKRAIITHEYLDARVEKKQISDEDICPERSSAKRGIPPQYLDTGVEKNSA